jgi:hypothetical protein
MNTQIFFGQWKIKFEEFCCLKNGFSALGSTPKNPRNEQNKTLIGYPCALANRPHSRAAPPRGRRGEGAVNDDRLARRNRLDSGRLAPGCGLLGIFA